LCGFADECGLCGLPAASAAGKAINALSAIAQIAQPTRFIKECLPPNMLASSLKLHCKILLLSVLTNGDVIVTSNAAFLSSRICAQREKSWLQQEGVSLALAGLFGRFRSSFWGYA
jgi:hypothetical protein